MEVCFVQFKEKFLNALISGNADETNRLVNEFIESYSYECFVDEIVVKAMEEVGEKWKMKKLSLSELYFISLLVDKTLQRYHKTSEMISQVEEKPIVLEVMTYKDSHFLGKQLLKLTLSSYSIKYHEFENYSEDKDILNKIGELKLKYIFVSVLMYDSALRLKQLITKAKEMYPDIVFIVGGAPFRLDLTLAKEIGADLSKPTVNEAVRIFISLMEEANA